jgi:ABC-type dipeptide/oligopeptide/nickel transport system permease component
MKKFLVFFVPIVSILVLSVIVGAFFIEDIFNLVKLSRPMNSSIIPESDIQILLFLSIVGLVAIMRKRPNKK